MKKITQRLCFITFLSFFSHTIYAGNYARDCYDRFPGNNPQVLRQRQDCMRNKGDITKIEVNENSPEYKKLKKECEDKFANNAELFKMCLQAGGPEDLKKLVEEKAKNRQ